MDADPRYLAQPLPSCVKPEEPPSTGFTLVHVSGLPADCEDDAVESKLRYALLDGRRRQQQAAEAAVAVAAAAAPASDKSAAPAPSALEKLAALAEDVAAEEDRPKVAEEPCEAEGDEAANELPKVEAEENPFEVCAVVRDKDNLGICKGYCFLSFKFLSEAEAAVPLLNEAVEVAGCVIKAQLSKPKGLKVKPPPKSSKPAPEQHDLRIHRRRFKAVGTKASHGHVSSSGHNEDGSQNVTRNDRGRINDVCGTRTGKMPTTDETKMSSRSGFNA